MNSKQNKTPPEVGTKITGIVKGKTGMDLWYNPEKLERLCFPQLRKGNSPAQVRQAKEDIHYIMGMGIESGANPFFNDIMAYRTDETAKSKSELVIMFSIGFMLERAENQPGYLSHFTQAVYEKDIFVKKITMDGVSIEHTPDDLKGKDERGRIVRAYAVGRKAVGSRIETFYEEVDFPAYDKGNAFWKRDPEGQITKCALAKLLRRMFPGVLKKAYIEAEMPPIIDAEVTEVLKEPPAVQGQRFNIEEMKMELQQKLQKVYGNADLIEQVVMKATDDVTKTSLGDINDTDTLTLISAAADRELKDATR